MAFGCVFGRSPLLNRQGRIDILYDEAIAVSVSGQDLSLGLRLGSRTRTLSPTQVNTKIRKWLEFTLQLVITTEQLIEDVLIASWPYVARIAGEERSQGDEESHRM
jgi:hypothetical protein